MPCAMASYFLCLCLLWEVEQDTMESINTTVNKCYHDLPCKNI